MTYGDHIRKLDDEDIARLCAVAYVRGEMKLEPSLEGYYDIQIEKTRLKMLEWLKKEM